MRKLMPVSSALAAVMIAFVLSGCGVGDGKPINAPASLGSGAQTTADEAASTAAAKAAKAAEVAAADAAAKAKVKAAAAAKAAARSGGAGDSALPAGVVGGTGGGIFVNAASAKSNAPTLDVYEDFQCPPCAQLAKAIGPTMASMAEAGEIRLVMHTLSFLDGNFRNDSSTRSANAAGCAADAGKFLEYHSAVFAGQPAREGDGYTDAQLRAFAKTSGITGAALTTWQKCTSSGQHAQYVTDVQKASERAGVNSTPTIKLNGQDVTQSVLTAEALVSAVKTATK